MPGMGMTQKTVFLQCPASWEVPDIKGVSHAFLIFSHSRADLFPEISPFPQDPHQ